MQKNIQGNTQVFKHSSGFQKNTSVWILTRQATLIGKVVAKPTRSRVYTHCNSCMIRNKQATRFNLSANFVRNPTHGPSIWWKDLGLTVPTCVLLYLFKENDKWRRRFKIVKYQLNKICKACHQGS